MENKQIYSISVKTQLYSINLCNFFQKKKFMCAIGDNMSSNFIGVCQNHILYSSSFFEHPHTIFFYRIKRFNGKDKLPLKVKIKESRRELKIKLKNEWCNESHVATSFSFYILCVFYHAPLASFGPLF